MAAGGSMLFMSSCGTEEANRFDNPETFFQEDAVEFVNKSNASSSTGGGVIENWSKPRCFIDNSWGMAPVYKEGLGQEIIAFIQSKLSGSYDFYKMGNDDVVPFQDQSIKGIELQLANNDRQSVAPIAKTIDQIVHGNKDAVLITDFEEYEMSRDGDILGPFAKDDFKDWLMGGHSLNLYYINSGEDALPKKFCIFIFNYDPANPETKNKLNLDKFEGFNSIPELTTQFYTVNNSYGGNEKHAIVANSEDKEAFDVNNSEGALTSFSKINSKAEILDFSGLSLGELYSTYFYPFDSEDNEPKNNIVFSRELFFDFSNNINYQVQNLDIEVFDVSNLFTVFEKEKWALENKPKLTKDDGNNVIWSEEDALDEKITAMFEKNSDKIKEDALFRVDNSKLNSIEEVFDFDRKVVSDCLKNSPEKVEFILKFHENFNSAKYSSSEDVSFHVYRVDVKLTDVISSNNESKGFNQLSWYSINTSTKGQINSSLANSLNEALNNSNPKDQTIYSYYIKTL